MLTNEMSNETGYAAAHAIQPVSAHTVPVAPDPTAETPPLDPRYDWDALARPNQKIPEGDWQTWLLLAGRGFGKTRTGAETIRKWVKEGTAARLALIGATVDDVERVMLEGHSGLMNITPASLSSRELDEPTTNGSGARILLPGTHPVSA